MKVGDGGTRKITRCCASVSESGHSKFLDFRADCGILEGLSGYLTFRNAVGITGSRRGGRDLHQWRTVLEW
jgi:hypothetical protein